MDELMAKRYIGRINSGFSRPILVECIDNKIYVIKYIGNQVSNKVLINDLICSRLAKKVGIMVPDAKIIYVPEVLIETEEEIKKANIRPGKHFGSLYYKNTIDFTGELILKQITNKEQIPKIIAFDFWVGNDDRTDNLGNLLISTSKKDKRIIAIDYGNAFNGPEWIDDDLKYTDISIIPIDGRVYSCLFKEVKSLDYFDDICTKIESLSLDDIKECMQDIPLEWGYNQIQADLMSKFLYKRKSEIRETMDYVLREKVGI